jgi:hypothetical protein
MSAQWANAKIRPLQKMVFVAVSLVDFPAL